MTQTQYKLKCYKQNSSSLQTYGGFKYREKIVSLGHLDKFVLHFSFVKENKDQQIPAALIDPICVAFCSCQVVVCSSLSGKIMHYMVL